MALTFSKVIKTLISLSIPGTFVNSILQTYERNICIYNVIVSSQIGYEKSNLNDLFSENKMNLRVVLI